ncbi:DUF5597 domain-containing protein [Microbacterium hominis]|uniref:DUF5597 domain-containing protein n=1 Tax=Microbacterium hominis TaxID=162426 RepID=A0A7D4THX6_9MICO|nr:DUF5597 domain-containing protein [Microbacterium hominis]QKJ20421.1 DUF5597 domain-containing protein [Microbacterium hominis]
MTGAWTFRTHAVGELVQGDESRLLLGGQLHNSSASTLASITHALAHVRRLHTNTVIAPVSWGQLEPEEGIFDFALVDHLVESARSAGLRLVLLWFGAYKNAASTYAPTWVRADRARFPRAAVEERAATAFTYEGATPKPVLSVFSPALTSADAAAVEALAQHIAELGAQDVVPLLQIENEVGILADSRDRSSGAEAAWRSPVPEALLGLAVAADPATSHAGRLWREAGAREGGTWPEVFGDDWQAEELFMAWAFASHAEELSQRVRRHLATPTYANAWLGPQPGQDRAGQYPSGGPGARVLDVWQAAAPSLAMLSPDIYVTDTEPAMRAYADANTLFVPECRLSAAELVRAVGVHGAVGWSAFGIDDVREHGQIATTLRFLAAFEPLLAHARTQGSLTAAVIDPDVEEERRQLGDVGITFRGSLALLRRMLLDAGVQAPPPTIDLPMETAPHALIPAPAEERPFALIVRETQDVFIAIGQGMTLDFDVDGQVEIDAVHELVFEDDRLGEGRELNGDERLRLLPIDSVGAVRIRLLRPSSTGEDQS